MSTEFERSLRGAAPAPTEAYSKSSATHKKKSVRWGDDDRGGQNLEDCAKSSKENSRFNIGGTQGALRTSKFPKAGIRSNQDKSIDHLRVPSTRLRPTINSTASRGDIERNHDSHEANSSVLASRRKRIGERGIQGGAVRVRTPAKPKRTRPDATATFSTALSAVRRVSAAGQASGSKHDAEATLRSEAVIPRNFLRRGGGVTSHVTSPNSKICPSRGQRATDAVGAEDSINTSIERFSVCGRSRNSKVPSPVCTSPRGPTNGVAVKVTTPRRSISSSQVLRNVAEGHDEDGGALDGLNEEDTEMVSIDASPMTLLSSTLSSIGLAAGAEDQPPGSPRVGGSLRAIGSPSIIESPRAGRPPRTRNASSKTRGSSRAVSIKGGSPRAINGGSSMSGGSPRGESPLECEYSFSRSDAGLEDDLDDDDGEEDDEVGSNSSRGGRHTGILEHTQPRKCLNRQKYTVELPHNGQILLCCSHGFAPRRPWCTGAILGEAPKAHSKDVTIFIS